MKLSIIGGVAVAALAACGLHEWLERRRGVARRDKAIETWHDVDPSVRADRLQRLTSSDPSNALAWYLRGCEAFRLRDLSAAARYFGMAHHLDPDLISAALLTFTALKSAHSYAPDSDAWLRELVETWREMKLPHNALDLVSDADGVLDKEFRSAPESLSSLGRLAWMVDARLDRAAIRELIQSRPTWASPLFQS